MLKLAISVDEETVRRVDQLSRKRRTTRSSFIRSAVQRAVMEALEEEIGDRIDAAYGSPDVEGETRKLAGQMASARPKLKGPEKW